MKTTSKKTFDPDAEFDCGLSFREFLQMEIETTLHKNGLLHGKTLEEISQKLPK